MSRGHGASRRRSYGSRQSEVRRRAERQPMLDLSGPTAWPRGSAWERGATEVAPAMRLPRGSAWERGATEVAPATWVHSSVDTTNRGGQLPADGGAR